MFDDLHVHIVPSNPCLSSTFILPIFRKILGYQKSRTPYGSQSCPINDDHISTSSSGFGRVTTLPDASGSLLSVRMSIGMSKASHAL